jgi:CBS domain containing-hemolysin-like protein
MLVGKDDGRRVTALTLYEPPCISPENKSIQGLQHILLTGHRKASHLALVCLNPDTAAAALRRHQPVPKEAGVLGIFTLENLLEQLIQEPIQDEKDKKVNRLTGVDQHAKAAIYKWKSLMQRSRAARRNSPVVRTMSLQSNPHPFG